MSAGHMLLRVRQEAGLSQEELAERVGTSRPTLSAYENDRKSPTVETMERLLSAAGFQLTVEPAISFVDHVVSRGRIATVPSRLPRLDPRKAFATVRLPLHLNWSHPGKISDLSDRGDRGRCYEVVLREGGADDILEYIDGALLVDLWPELVVPRDIRALWEPLVQMAS
ncbi:helix-turn-helix transcriptional regulator [Allokutzneria multivorans]